MLPEPFCGALSWTAVELALSWLRVPSPTAQEVTASSTAREGQCMCAGSAEDIPGEKLRRAGHTSVVLIQVSRVSGRPGAGDPGVSLVTRRVSCF